MLRGRPEKAQGRPLTDLNCEVPEPQSKTHCRKAPNSPSAPISTRSLEMLVRLTRAPAAGDRRPIAPPAARGPLPRRTRCPRSSGASSSWFGRERMYFSRGAPVRRKAHRVWRGTISPPPLLGFRSWAARRTGTGKSRVLEAVLSVLPTSSTYATAPTGVAACVIGGTTLHAFAGLGRIPTDASVKEAAERVRRNADAAMRWRGARALVVDEVSMLPAATFDLLDGVAKALRGSRYGLLSASRAPLAAAWSGEGELLTCSPLPRPQSAVWRHSSGPVRRLFPAPARDAGRGGVPPMLRKRSVVGGGAGHCGFASGIPADGRRVRRRIG